MRNSAQWTRLTMYRASGVTTSRAESDVMAPSVRADLLLLLFTVVYSGVNPCESLIPPCLHNRNSSLFNTASVNIKR